MATGRRGKARMIARNDGMPGGMCHPHASHGEAVISGENDGKWHVAAAASYYYIHMILPAPLGRFFDRFKYRRSKTMDNEEEKYRIKPRKKYARQVWSMDGKAIIVDPLDPDKPEIENKHGKEE